MVTLLGRVYGAAIGPKEDFPGRLSNTRIQTVRVITQESTVCSFMMLCMIYTPWYPNRQESSLED